MAKQGDSLPRHGRPKSGVPVVPTGAEQQLPAEKAWSVVSRLMTCLELDALIQEFAGTMSQLLDCAGVTYRRSEDAESLVYGDVAEHQAQYRLVAESEPLGVLTLHGERPFGPADLALADHCITLLITPLRNALKYQSARLEARTDPLTQLLNRSCMEECLGREIRLARRHNQDFSVIAVDLDDLKGVNDLHGHAAGDKVLQELAELLRRCARASELIFRKGGDEFLIALSHTSLAGARLLAERLCRAVDRHGFRYQGEELSVYVSIGVTSLNADDTIEGLLERMDTALYAAKGCGCNQVVHA